MILVIAMENRLNDDYDYDVSGDNDGGIKSTIIALLGKGSKKLRIWRRMAPLTTLNESAILIIIQAVFHGNYGDHECGITIDSATYQDEGTWR